MPGTSIDRERATSFRALFEDESSFRAWYEEALPRVFGYLVGQVMREAGGKANPDTINELLRTLLGNDG